MVITDDPIEPSTAPDLLRRARASDAEAFCRLIEPLQGALLRQAIMLSGDTAAAEDLVSETLVAAAGSARYLGRIDESLRLSHQAVDLDPLNATNLESLAETEFFAEELDAAGTDAKKSLDLNPEIWPGSILLSRIYLAQGRPREALPEIERVRYDVLQTYLYARAYRALGRERESDASLSKLIAKYSATNAYEIALVYASRNQADKAFDWLDRAYAERDPGLMATKADPELKGLRNDPRFTALLKKINLPI